MDSKLLDHTLIDLLRMPAAKRTPEVINAHLTLAATAAGLKLEGNTPLQLEQLKLLSAVSLLASNLGSNFTHRINLRLGQGLEGMELFAAIEHIHADKGPRFTGWGDTAERVLAKLRQEVSQHGLLPAPKPTTARRPNRDPLRHLPKPQRATA